MKVYTVSKYNEFEGTTSLISIHRTEEGPESLMKLQVTLASKQMNLPVEEVHNYFRIKEDFIEDEDYEE